MNVLRTTILGKKGLFLLCYLEDDEIVSVRALVGELVLVLTPGNGPSHTEGHQRRKQVVVAVAADAARLVGVDIKSIPYLVARAAVTLDGLYLSLENRFLPIHLFNQLQNLDVTIKGFPLIGNQPYLNEEYTVTPCMSNAECSLY